MIFLLKFFVALHTQHIKYLYKGKCLYVLFANHAWPCQVNSANITLRIMVSVTNSVKYAVIVIVSVIANSKA